MNEVDSRRGPRFVSFSRAISHFLTGAKTPWKVHITGHLQDGHVQDRQD